jgi:hypothetical protein
MPPEFEDRLSIREAIDNWMIWRDSGDWDRFATVWHPEGWMHTTWFQASAADFIARSRAAFETGTTTVLHVMSGASIDVTHDRAVSQTRSTIMQRGMIDGVQVDVACYGRFWDAWERVDGRWLLRMRQPIYEIDHLLPLDPAATLTLDPTILGSFPVGYKHLAYLQTKLGFDVSKTMPGTRGPEIEKLRGRGRDWLAGAAADCLTAKRESATCA